MSKVNPNRNVVIYGLIKKSEPKNIRYIGQTVDLIRRVAGHKHCLEKGMRTPLYDWMRKHEGELKKFNPRTGVRPSPETRLKISESLKGNSNRKGGST